MLRIRRDQKKNVNVSIFLQATRLVHYFEVFQILNFFTDMVFGVYWFKRLNPRIGWNDMLMGAYRNAYWFPLL